MSNQTGAALTPAAQAALESCRERLQFGTDVRMFCMQQGMRITELARRCDVKYYTLLGAMDAKVPGTKVIPKVKAYMESVRKLSHEQAVR